jgi:hypothetical protein
MSNKAGRESVFLNLRSFKGGISGSFLGVKSQALPMKNLIKLFARLFSWSSLSATFWIVEDAKKVTHE